MIGYGEAPRAWGLTRGMARVVGVNLSAAVVEGWFNRAELDRLIGRCSTCGQSLACIDYLSQAVAAPALPAFCRNKDAIEALAPDA